MKSLLILFATEIEASQTISLLKAKLKREGNISYYNFSKGRIVLTGLGTYAAQQAVLNHITYCQQIWNIGFAGALNNELPIGTLIPIHKVGKHCFLPDQGLDPLSFNFLNDALPTISLTQQSGGRLLSFDYPLHDNQERKKLSSNWDLVDMEGYGIAYATRTFQIPCHMWKIVSDFASTGGRELLKKNILPLSEKIANFLIKML